MVARGEESRGYIRLNRRSAWLHQRCLSPCSPILYYTILYCSYNVLCCTILYYTIPYYTTLHYTTLHYTTLYSSIIYYSILDLHYDITRYDILWYEITTMLQCSPSFSVGRTRVLREFAKIMAI